MSASSCACTALVTSALLGCISGVVSGAYGVTEARRDSGDVKCLRRSAPSHLFLPCCHQRHRIPPPREWRRLRDSQGNRVRRVGCGHRRQAVAWLTGARMAAVWPRHVRHEMVMWRHYHPTPSNCPCRPASATRPSPSASACRADGSRAKRMPPLRIELRARDYETHVLPLHHRGRGCCAVHADSVSARAGELGFAQRRRAPASLASMSDGEGGAAGGPPPVMDGVSHGVCQRSRSR